MILFAILRSIQHYYLLILYVIWFKILSRPWNIKQTLFLITCKNILVFLSLFHRIISRTKYERQESFNKRWLFVFSFVCFFVLRPLSRHRDTPVTSEDESFNRSARVCVTLSPIDFDADPNMVAPLQEIQELPEDEELLPASPSSSTAKRFLRYSPGSSVHISDTSTGKIWWLCRCFWRTSITKRPDDK